jgi:hypothetical protein
MENGAKGVEVIISGKLRAQRAKAMKFRRSCGTHTALLTQHNGWLNGYVVVIIHGKASVVFTGCKFMGYTPSYMLYIYWILKAVQLPGFAEAMSIVFSMFPMSESTT